MSANFPEINFELERKSKLIADLTLTVNRLTAELAAHAATIEQLRKLCGEAAKRLVHYEDYPDDKALVDSLRAAEKGGGK